MKRWIILLGCCGAALVNALAQENSNSRRPVERPSRVIEALQQQKPAREEPTPEKPAASAPSVPSKPAEIKTRVIFRVPGGEAWAAASAAGWKFFPQGARGPLNGHGTTAEIHPGVVSSTVRGPRMEQMFTPAQWGRISQNTFYMFADASGRAKRLSEGWTVVDVGVRGDPFEWVSRPKKGSRSPSLAIRLAGQRIARNSVVEITGLVLQGPPGAKDWREAFGPPLKP